MSVNVLPTKKITTQTVAKVAQIDRYGRVRAIFLEDHTSIPVFSQLCSVPPCEVGQWVSLQYCEQGLLVMGRILGEHDLPAADWQSDDGDVALRGAKSLNVRIGQSHFQLTDCGSVTLNGVDVNVDSEQDLSFTGWPIRLN